MKDMAPRRSFEPRPPDAAGVVSWVHLGDLHMTKTGEQNHLDLAEIVDKINKAFAYSISFVLLPGDVADDGSRDAYEVVRGELDRLDAPWCAIIGDHDVHEQGFINFLETMSQDTHYAFTIGAVRFLAMNAFDVPDPGSFTVSMGQLAWAKGELQSATDAGKTKVLLLHCYPSDLKAGGAELMELVRNFNVSVIDMGHTHYNEIANDGRTVYSATRSIGQIEEGPVGYSITNIDDEVVSWRFIELEELPVVMITSPSDERLLTTSSKILQKTLSVRAKFWGEWEAVRAIITIDTKSIPMTRINDSQVWEAEVSAPHDGVYPLKVSIEDARGKMAIDEIRLVIGRHAERESLRRDQDNALSAWPEHGLLGTQLGPNKNGKKW